MGVIRRTVLLAALTCGFLLSTTEAGTAATAPVARAASLAPVTSTTMTFVDTSRPTPSWNGMPEKSSRTLVTTIWFPSRRSGSVATAGGGTYPLIVFAHGLGGSPQGYEKLLTEWAAAGYVVAAPLFPLSSSETPGGADGGDIGNQPGDMSFVIDQVLKASAASKGPLSGLVNPSEIGAAGHSNGAITTLGLVANSCCRDARVKAAVVMAGTTEGLGTGHYNLAEAPPLLVVQDLHDGLIPYPDAVAVFNKARGPKALLALDWDSHPDASGSSAHMAASGEVGPTSGPVIKSTTAFFNAFLKHETGARQAVAATGRSSLSTVHTAWADGSRATLPVPKTAARNLRASVTPAAGLHDGQAVTVRWSGYTAGKVVNVLECSHVDIATASSAGCSFAHAAILHPDPTGSGSVILHVGTGPIGNGVCDAAHSCYVIVNNASSTDPSGTKKLPIRFAP
jgi:dienelactone hydrolase